MENRVICMLTVKINFRDLMKFNSMLTHVIIDALTNLPLSYELRSQVREKIITRLEKCPAEFLPLLVQFAVTRCDPNDLLQVILILKVAI